MADAYLLENGVDRYLLEDGLGVLVLEVAETTTEQPASACVSTHGAVWM